MFLYKFINTAFPLHNKIKRYLTIETDIILPGHSVHSEEFQYIL